MNELFSFLFSNDALKVAVNTFEMFNAKYSTKTPNIKIT